MSETTPEHYLPGLAQPAPTADGLDAPFWEGSRRHRLVLQNCNTCGRFQMPPEWLCHHCHSFDLTWKEVAGEGVIYSWMRVHHTSLPSIRDRVPYLVVVVELPAADKVKLVGNLLGDPHCPVAIGASVEVVFEDHEQATLVHWRPAR
ncbi:MAG: Zn-ribbon domain-containing OB-fold protein [Pseudomonadota bacterium]